VEKLFGEAARRVARLGGLEGASPRFALGAQSAEEIKAAPSELKPSLRLEFLLFWDFVRLESETI